MNSNQSARPSAAHRPQPYTGTICVMVGQNRITTDVHPQGKRYTCDIDRGLSPLEQINRLLDDLASDYEVELYDHRVSVVYAGKVYRWDHFGAHKCFHHGSLSLEEFAQSIRFVQPNVGRA